MGDDDEVKKQILARRAKLIAAALVGAGAVAGCETTEPRVCLSIESPRPDGAVPQPCLTPLPVDSGPRDDGGPRDAGDAGDSGSRDT